MCTGLNPSWNCFIRNASLAIAQRASRTARIALYTLIKLCFKIFKPFTCIHLFNCINLRKHFIAYFRSFFLFTKNCIRIKRFVCFTRNTFSCKCFSVELHSKIFYNTGAIKTYYMYVFTLQLIFLNQGNYRMYVARLCSYCKFQHSTIHAAQLFHSRLC